MLRTGEVIATQEVRFAATDVKGRLIRFPPELAESLEQYAAPPAE
jgi:acyl-CoA thioesterase FadM